MWITGEYFDGLRAAELAARGRLGAPAQPDPLLRLEWFARTWEQAPPGKRPLIVRARAGQAEAWLFLARSRPGSAVALAGEHSFRFAPIFVGSPDDALKQILLRAMARRLKMLGLSHLSLAPMPVEDAALMRASFGRAGWTAIDRPGPQNYWLDIAGRHFEDYWETCPPDLHEQVATGSRQLEVEIADLLTPRLWDEIALIGGAGPFLRELAQDATLDNTLRLGIARVGDAPVAAQLWTVENGRGTAHWRAEDPDAKHLFPGADLTASMLRYLMNVDHAEKVDLGTGRAAELAAWADERRPLRSLELFNPRAPSAWVPALSARIAGLVRRAPLD
ncbi:MAG TPA: GNAT family N-acetyltransferase [Pseudolabrys sp.]